MRIEPLDMLGLTANLTYDFGYGKTGHVEAAREGDALAIPQRRGRAVYGVSILGWGRLLLWKSMYKTFSTNSIPINWHSRNSAAN